MSFRIPNLGELEGGAYPTFWVDPDSGDKIPIARPVILTLEDGSHVAVPQTGASLMAEVVVMSLMQQIVQATVGTMIRSLKDRCCYAASESTAPCGITRAVHNEAHDFVEQGEANGPPHDPFHENGERTEDVDDNAPR